MNYFSFFRRAYPGNFANIFFIFDSAYKISDRFFALAPYHIIKGSFFKRFFWDKRRMSSSSDEGQVSLIIFQHLGQVVSGSGIGGHKGNADNVRFKIFYGVHYFPVNFMVGTVIFKILFLIHDNFFPFIVYVFEKRFSVKDFYFVTFFI